jgi:hypothetical protein
MQQVVLMLTAHQEGCLDSIATSLESIAKSLETLRCNATPKDPREYDGMGPGSDDV